MKQSAVLLTCIKLPHGVTRKRERELVALLLLSIRCLVNVNVLWLFFTLPWAGLQCVIVVFPDHIHLLF